MPLRFPSRVAEVEFQIGFEGPAVDSGRMSVGDLAPALIALSELAQHANALVRPQDPPLSLDIRATRHGSFDVFLILSHDASTLVDRLTSLFTTPGADALDRLLKYIGIGGAGLIWLIKKIGKRRILSKRELRPGTIQLTLDDRTTIEIPPEVLWLFESLAIRRDLEKTIRPLHRDGVDRVVFRRGDAVETVESAQVEEFNTPEPRERLIVDQEVEMGLTAVRLDFKPGNQWRFSDGDQTFSARILDESFLERIDENQESFSKGDILRCKVRVKQWQEADGNLKVERSIIDVYEHAHPVHTDQAAFPI